MTETRVAGNDFGWALEQLWNGLKVRRPEWPPYCKLTLEYDPPDIVILTPDYTHCVVYRCGYVARNHELLATDWVLA